MAWRSGNMHGVCAAACTTAGCTRVDVRWEDKRPGADDVVGLLQEWWQQPFTTSRQEFLQRAAAAPAHDFAELGQPLSTLPGPAPGQQVQLHHARMADTPGWFKVGGCWQCSSVRQLLGISSCCVQCIIWSKRPYAVPASGLCKYRPSSPIGAAVGICSRCKSLLLCWLSCALPVSTHAAPHAQSHAWHAPQELHGRMQPLLIFTIDGANYIDTSDLKWEVVAAVLERDNKQQLVRWCVAVSTLLGCSIPEPITDSIIMHGSSSGSSGGR